MKDPNDRDFLVVVSGDQPPLPHTSPQAVFNRTKARDSRPSQLAAGLQREVEKALGFLGQVASTRERIARLLPTLEQGFTVVHEQREAARGGDLTEELEDNHYALRRQVLNARHGLQRWTRAQQDWEAQAAGLQRLLEEFQTELVEREPPRTVIVVQPAPKPRDLLDRVLRRG